MTRHPLGLNLRAGRARLDAGQCGYFVDFSVKPWSCGQLVDFRRKIVVASRRLSDGQDKVREKD